MPKKLLDMNLNPFDLRGPEFLVFYAFFSLVVLVLLKRVQRAREQRESAALANARLPARSRKTLERDPYRIAYLNGGQNEAIQTAIISLLERGLLEMLDDGRLQTTAPGNARKARHPLDKAILGIYAVPGTAQSLCANSIVMAEIRSIHIKLLNVRLLSDGRRKFSGFGFLWALCAFWSVAVVKIVVAFSRGHHNVLFLIGMAIIASVVALIILRRAPHARTPLGETVLGELRAQFDSLYVRRKSLQFDGQTGEIAFLTAVFGMEALSEEVIGIPVSSLLLPKSPLKVLSSGSSYRGSGSSCSS